MREEEVRAVLSWMRDYLAYVSNDISKTSEMLVDFGKNKDKIFKAIKEAAYPELKGLIEELFRMVMMLGGIGSEDKGASR